jgi:hypothetical protein
MAGFGISSVEPSGSATAVSVSKMDLRETGCEDGRWMELAQDRVQWQALVLAVLNLPVLLPESFLELRQAAREYETSILRLGFEPATPACRRHKTVSTLNSSV